MSTQKTPLGGRPISRKEAFKGLGDPKTWKKFSDAVYAEFRGKPKTAKDSILGTATEKVKKTFRRETGQKIEPVYAKPVNRKNPKMRSSKMKRRKKK